MSKFESMMSCKKENICTFVFLLLIGSIRFFSSEEEIYCARVYIEMEIGDVEATDPVVHKGDENSDEASCAKLKSDAAHSETHTEEETTRDEPALEEPSPQTANGIDVAAEAAAAAASDHVIVTSNGKHHSESEASDHEDGEPTHVATTNTDNQIADASSNQQQDGDGDDKALSSRNSVEFSYTSLGGVKPADDSDELQDETTAPVTSTGNVYHSEDEDEAAPVGPISSSVNLVNDSIGGIGGTGDSSAVVEDDENGDGGGDDDDDDDSKSDDSTRHLSFDVIIERVKLNHIANKDVCNYMLNLLVDGEFDLEKNFVIKNVNSILNLIQVIKCARSSLKVTQSTSEACQLLNYFPTIISILCR